MPSARLYGIVDCAIDPMLHEFMSRLEPNSALCLFRGDVHPEVKAVSPYVVDLAADDLLHRRWRQVGWGKAWGLWVVSSVDLEDIWQRLRHFTQARLPSGEGPLLFRFWDPRVLRVFLPLVEPSEIDDWFREIDAWIVEAEDGVGALRFTCPDGRFVSERLASI